MDYVDDYLFEGLHLLVAEDGSVETADGRPFLQLAAGKFWVNNHAHVLKGATDGETRFLYYALNTVAIRPFMSGSVQAKLSQRNMNQIPVPYPPEPSQRRSIAYVLGSLDDKVELNRRMSETLEAIARALFKSWFVDFDPVRAKAEGGDRGLSEPLADSFPNRFERSDVGEIPAGWQVGRFGDVVETLREQVNPLDSPGTTFQHYSIPAFDDRQRPRAEKGNSIKSLKFHVPSETVLMSKLNPEIERVWLVDVTAGDQAVCSTEFLVLRGRRPFTRAYVYCLARSTTLRQGIEGMVTGTSKSHQRAQAASVLSLPVVIPDAKIIEAFDRTASAALARSLACRRESIALMFLRGALLPKLVSGELRVNDAERIIGKAN
jgi:type I restriction enzyme S subunit